MNKLQQHFDQKFEHNFDQKFDHFDACASESDNRDSKELDVESDNNDLNSASTRSEDYEEYKGFDRSEKYNFNYPRQESSDRSYDNVGGYYFPSVYPEYLVPRTFCKESNDDVPCDLSNWHRGLKFDQNVSSQMANTSGSVGGDRDSATQNGDQTDLTNNADQGDQPINFAYYHF